MHNMSKNSINMDISINIGGSIIYPEKFVIESGLSLIYLFPDASKLGLVFNSTKLKCSECNTPVAEISNGSLIIKSRHHSQRHATAIPINQLTKFIA